MTKYQNTLFDKAHRALETAHLNLDHGDVHAAINRAYYAAFYAATAALLAQGEAPKTHQGVHRRFDLHFVASGVFPKEMGGILAFAGEARQQADYDAFSVFDQGAVAALIDDVERFIEAVAVMLAT